MKAIQLLPTNLYAVEIPKGYGLNLDTMLDEWVIRPSNRMPENAIILDLKLGPEYDFLGTVTKDKVSFDVEPYVENELKSVGYIYMDYNQPENTKRPYKFDYANDSFVSLLQSNGLFFTNPMGGKPDYAPVEPYSSKINETIYNDTCGEWDRAEEGLVKGKLLIFIKK